MLARLVNTLKLTAAAALVATSAAIGLTRLAFKGWDDLD